MKTNKKIINFSLIDVSMDTVKFTRIDNKDGNYEVVCKDEIQIINAFDNGFNLLVSRNTFFKPKALFSIYVSFRVNCLFDKNSRNFYNGDLKEINSFIEKRKKEILNDTGVWKKISIVITQLTHMNNENSIITPPFYFED